MLEKPQRDVEALPLYASRETERLTTKINSATSASIFQQLWNNIQLFVSLRACLNVEYHKKDVKRNFECW